MDFSNKENAPQRHYHSSFATKPTPTLQLIAQSSHLNEEGRSNNAYRNPAEYESVQAVPTTWDSVYDPSHPDADWSGLVSRAHTHKRHINNPIAHQESLERNEYGIVSKEEKQEWARKRTSQDPNISKNAGSLVIGGIDNPDERWKSSYTRFANHEGTARDQLTLEKRSNAIKRIPDPAQARGSAQNTPRDYHEGGNTYAMSSQMQATRTRDPVINGRTSLLSGLGEKIVQNKTIPVDAPHFKQPRPNENYRVLLGDNFKQFPGKKSSSLSTLHALNNIMIIDYL